MTLPPPEHDDPAPISSAVSHHQPLSRDLLLLFVALWLCLLVPISLHALIPRLLPWLDALPRPLPTDTRLALAYYPLLVLLPLPSLAVWFGTRRRAWRGLATLLCGLCSALLAALAVGLALSRPFS